jgi:hypothetical protein
MVVVDKKEATDAYQRLVVKGMHSLAQPFPIWKPQQK